MQDMMLSGESEGMQSGGDLGVTWATTRAQEHKKTIDKLCSCCQLYVELVTIEFEIRSLVQGAEKSFGGVEIES